LSLRAVALERERQAFVGREVELAVLSQVLGEGGPLVAFVHGVAGIGKSALLKAFARSARERGATVLRIDCGNIEPTDRGFLSELRRAVGAGEAGDPVERIAALDPPVVLLVDTYEAFRISDAWLRQVLLAGLPTNARMVIAGRDAPSIAWFGALGWSGSLAALELGPLGEKEAHELLRPSGLAPAQVHRINRIARGHPLALCVAAAAAVGAVPEPALEELVTQRVMEELAHRYLEQLDPLTRRTLDAASVVRRTTPPLLGAMLGDAAPQDAFERLASLPFVHAASDGLTLHETLQQAIATRLSSLDPARHRAYRQAAWRRLRSELRDAGETELWRYTADMLYLIDNPLVREAFFPAGMQLHTVEPARPDDAPAILETITRHDGPQAAAIEHGWWERAPQTFRVIRDRSGVVAGFCQIFEVAAVPMRSWPHDPVALAWLEHARRELPRRGELVLFSRRELDREGGEAPGAVQAACFLDVKRLYMSLRPRLRRLYWTARAVLDFMPALGPLGFVALPDLTVRLDGVPYPTVMLDFGPGSIDEWLARVAASELGIPQDELLDLEAREAVVDGGRVPLTKLEFALLHHLMQREGKAVSRVELLQEVWGDTYAGDSNVVEAAVRSLRRKLAGRSAVVETVRGIGYRYRRG
jgi:transcriptional regulator/AAA ATPase-like protein